MKNKDFMYYIVNYLLILLIIFLYQFFSIDYRIIILFLILIFLFSLYQNKYKNVKSYTPKILTIIFTVMAVLPTYLNLKNFFAYYLVLITLLIVIEYYYNTKQLTKNN